MTTFFGILVPSIGYTLPPVAGTSPAPVSAADAGFHPEDSFQMGNFPITAPSSNPISRTFGPLVSFVTDFLAAGRSIPDTIRDGLSVLTSPSLALAGAPGEVMQMGGSRVFSVLMDGPGDAFTLINNGGKDISHLHTWTIEELRMYLLRRGETEDEIARIMAQLEWKWRLAQRSSRLAAQSNPNAPRNWRPPKEPMMYVSAKTRASDGAIVSLTPLGEMTDRERAIFRPRDNA